MKNNPKYSVVSRGNNSSENEEFIYISNLNYSLNELVVSRFY